MNATQNIAGSLLLMVSALMPCAMADPAPASPPVKPAAASPAAPGPPTLKLPGMVINREQRCVDVESTVCLVEGSLELVACTKEGKTHESIITVEARALHIHTGLLLLGAKSGNPAMRKAINEEQTRWVDIPPQGDPIDASLVWKNEDGSMTERPIGDFISYNDHESEDPGAEKKDAATKKFPSSFVFAGSLLGDENKKPREYLADVSGNVISISTYGDELLCLPGFESQDNGSLVWEVNTENIPKLGTKVTLRLRPHQPAQATPKIKPDEK